MAKLERKTQKTFAGQAGSRQITAFGTAKSDTPVYTNDISLIQNTNFLYGWANALLPDKSPWEEDMNALFYAVTRQLAYLFQEGIPEYDPETEYSLSAFVRGIGSPTLYYSLTQNNIGNNLNDTNYWAVFFDASTVENINNQMNDLKKYIDEQLKVLNTTLNQSIQKQIPNYSGGINVAFPTSTNKFTAPSNGIYVTTCGRNNAQETLYINNIATAFIAYDGAERVSYQAFTIPLSEGDVIYWSATASIRSSMFYPYKNS